MKREYIHTKKKYEAISIVEVALAIPLLLFVIISVVGIIASVMHDASGSIVKSNAIFLAEGGHEYARDLRDAYFEKLEEEVYLGFDGTESYVDIEHDEAIDVTQELTLSARVKPAQDNTVGYILSKQNGLDPGGYGLYWDGENDRVRFYYVDDEGESQIEDSVEEFTDYDEWVNVAVTLDDTGTLYFYKNGDLKNTVDADVSLLSNDESLYLGNRPGGGDSAHLFEGLVNNVRIYDRNLNDSEIEDLHNDINIETDLVGHWILDEGSGSIAYDSTVNDNNGDIYDAEWIEKNTSLDNWAGVEDAFLLFDGEDTYGDCGDDESLTPTDAITISHWVKPYNLEKMWQRIIMRAKGTLHMDRAYDSYLDHNKNGEWMLSLGEGARSSGYIPPEDTWTLLTVTYDVGNEEVIFYINGQYEKTVGTDGESLVDVPNNPTLIGNFEGLDRHFDGKINDVRIYERALSSNEISDLHGGSDITNGLVGHWELDEGYGYLGSDASGNENHCNITSPTWIKEDDFSDLDRRIMIYPYEEEQNLMEAEVMMEGRRPRDFIRTKQLLGDW